MTRSPRSTVVAVSGDSRRAELLHALVLDPHDFDVVFVESIARGYARIKELRPDIVVVFMAIDDVAACQLLSMLNIDRSVSSIPVVTSVTGRSSAIAEPIHPGIETMLARELWM